MDSDIHGDPGVSASQETRAPGFACSCGRRGRVYCRGLWCAQELESKPCSPGSFAGSLRPPIPLQLTVVGVRVLDQQNCRSGLLWFTVVSNPSPYTAGRDRTAPALPLPLFLKAVPRPFGNCRGSPSIPLHPDKTALITA